MRRLVIIFVLVGALVAPQSAVWAQRRSGNAAAGVAASSARHGAEQITAEQLRDYLIFIAADEMEGRDTPSRGLDLTAKFLAVQLSRWGFKPAGDDGTFFQKIALRRERVDLRQTRVEIGGQQFKPGTDFLAFAPLNNLNFSGGVVFAGHGWLVRSKNIDPYAGLNVRDKVVVIVGGDGLPQGVSHNDLVGTSGVDWDDPISYATRMGARALLAIPDAQIVANWERFRQAIMERRQTVVEKFRKPPQQQQAMLPRMIMSPQMVTALFQGEAHTAAAINAGLSSGTLVAPFELSAAKRINLNLVAEPQFINTQNVVAVLEGSDPLLKNEYVAVGAHYDHVGLGTPVGGDAIYNGADDDGSGTTAALAIAEALAKTNPRPRRSVLVVWHCGEEKGLWGSRYFVENPTVPLAQVVAQLNIDMIGRSRRAGDTNPANRDLSGPDEIYVIGSKMMSTELGQLSERVNRRYLNLAFNYKYDDPNDPERFFFRSDHFNYAQKGIPIIFYFDGVHEDYHRPGDEVSKIDFRKMERVTRTIYATLRELANAPTRPRVDKQLPAELRN